MQDDNNVPSILSKVSVDHTPEPCLANIVRTSFWYRGHKAIRTPYDYINSFRRAVSLKQRRLAMNARPLTFMQRNYRSRI